MSISKRGSSTPVGDDAPLGGSTSVGDQFNRFEAGIGSPADDVDNRGPEIGIGAPADDVGDPGPEIGISAPADDVGRPGPEIGISTPTTDDVVPADSAPGGDITSSGDAGDGLSDPGTWESVTHVTIVEGCGCSACQGMLAAKGDGDTGPNGGNPTASNPESGNIGQLLTLGTNPDGSRFFSGNRNVDATLIGSKWGIQNLTYSFPTSGTNYNGIGLDSNGVNAYHIDLGPQQQAAARAAFAIISAATGLTFTEITETDTVHANIRISQTADQDAPSAYGGFPSDTRGVAGDIWFGRTSQPYYDLAYKGTWGFSTMMHEIGHTMGLKHGHQDYTNLDLSFYFGTSPRNGSQSLTPDRDGQAWSLMTYTPAPFTNSNFAGDKISQPQTYMQYDLAALQYMYGANFNTNSGDTVYTFSQTTGEMFINGVGQGAPSGNKILLTIWDGGGNDTIDASNYANGVTIDLRPGEFSTFDPAQLANHLAAQNLTALAPGNIAMSLLYNNDGRSLIENATGGTGNDIFVGNIANNVLDGGAGSDTVIFTSTTGVNVTLNDTNTDVIVTHDGETDTLRSIENIGGTSGNDTITGNSLDNVLTGGTGGTDSLSGGDGNDRLIGGGFTVTTNFIVGSPASQPDIVKPQATNNNSIANAVNTAGFFDIDANPNIANAATVPHATINATAAGGAVEYYRIEVAGAGAQAIFDIDGVGTLTDSIIELVDSQGNLLANNDTGPGDPGTTTGDDAYIPYTFAAPGTYYIRVGRFISGSSIAQPMLAGQTYTLNISLQGAAGSTTFTLNNTSSLAADGGEGNDHLQGTVGDDTLTGGNGNDTASFATAYNGGGSGTTGVTVDLNTQGVAQNTVAAGSDTLSGIENLIGSQYNDALTGDGNDNFIEGGLGTDTLVGGLGNDTASYAGATAGVTASLALQGAGQNTVNAGTDTLSEFENLAGSAFNDSLSGDANANTLSGGSGDDALNPGANPGGTVDLLDGGLGTDTASFAGNAAGVTATLNGVADGTATVGGLAIATLRSIENLAGSANADILTGDSNANVIEGGLGDDTLDGGLGVDTLAFGGSTAVTVNLATLTAQNTGWGSDTILNFENVRTGSGADNVTGDLNENIFFDGGGADTYNGAAGSDTVDYTNIVAALTVNLTLAGAQAASTGGDILSNIENVTGSLTAANTLTGSTLANRLTGGSAADLIIGGNGADTILGGAGNDILLGGTGSGTDDGTADTVEGGAGADFVSGGQGNDIVRGGDGNDTLVGGAGNNLSQFFTGVDGGDDTYDGGDGTDVAIMVYDTRAGVGASTVGISFDLGSLAGNSNITFNGVTVGSMTSIERATFRGTNVDDNVRGGGSLDSLTGGAGNDVLDGWIGNDLLEGGLGDDTLIGGEGLDTAAYAGSTAGVNVDLRIDGVAQNTGGQGTDTLSGIEYLTGSAFGDTLRGNDDFNLITDTGVGAGATALSQTDSLFGYGGKDSIHVTRAAAAVATNINMDGGDGDDFLELRGGTLSTALAANLAGLSALPTGGNVTYLVAGATSNDRNLDVVSVDGGAGNDRIILTGVASATINAGSGADLVSISMRGATSVNNYQLTLGSGADVIQLGVGANAAASTDVATTVRTNRVTDFERGDAGDKFEWTNFLNLGLTGYTANSNAFASGNLRLTQSGSDLLVQVDRDGGGATNSFVTVFAISNGYTGGFTAFNFDGFIGNLNLTGIGALDETITGATGNDVLSGGDGNDVLIGLAGTDTLNGGAGNDTLDGGTGTDTAAYGGPATITQTATGWSVTTASEGTDTLENVEIVNDSAAGVTRLVGNGGYASIQAAIDASSDGDTIVVASGTWTENLAVNKDVTILGANNHGVDGNAARGAESIIDGQIIVTAAGATIDGFKLIGDQLGTFGNTAVEVQASNFTLANTIMDGDGDVAILVFAGTAGLDVGHNRVEGYSIGVYVGGGDTAGSIHDNRFQGEGGPIGGLGEGVRTESSHVAIANNAFDGIYAATLNITSFGPDSVDLNAYITGNTITNSGIARPVQILPSNLTHNFIGTDFNEAFDGETAAGSYGVTGAFSFDGRGGDDKAWGGEQGDSFTGGTGTDELNGNGGDDTLSGGGDDDNLNGGDGTDTATYAGPVGDYSITATTDSDGRVIGYSAVVDNVPAGGDEGSDALTGIEKLSFGNATLNLADPVQLFDSGNNLIGTYGSIQAAVDASSDGQTIRVAAGTYNETVNVHKDVTILGPNAGVAGTGARDAEAIVNGGFYMSAAGATLDGLTILNGAMPGGNSAGIFVNADNVTLANMILEGDGTDQRAGVTTTYNGGITGLVLMDSLVTGWDWGAYFNPTTQFTVTGNSFDGNGNAILGDDWAAGTYIDGNSFTDSTGSHIGYGSFDTIEDMRVYFTNPDTSEDADEELGNSFDPDSRAVSIYVYGDGTPGGQTITGTEDSNAFVASEFVPGSGTNSTFFGLGGNDSFYGGKSNDTLNGGAGTDTAYYDGNRSDYSIGTSTAAGGRVVSFTSVSDNEKGNGDEGNDTLVSIEVLVFANKTLDLTMPVQLFDQTNQLLGTFTTIQAAIDLAQDGYTIRLAAGTYDEDLLIDVGVTIRGARTTTAGHAAGRNAADGVGESTIIGHHKVTAENNVSLLGLRFLNDSTTTGGGPSNPTLQYLTGGTSGHSVTNSIFWSSVAGGAANDRAISAPGIATGQLTLTGNLISGASQGLFGTASWGQAIWMDGGGVALTASNNVIEWTKTGLSLDGAGGSVYFVNSNVLRNLGTAFAMGTTEDGLVEFGNTFRNVDTEYNFRNLAEDITFDAGLSGNTLQTVGTGNDTIVILGGSGNDTLTGTNNADYIDANNRPGHLTVADTDTLNGGGGNDMLFGRFGTDTLNGGTGADSLDGGDGNDILNGDADNDTLAGGAGDDSLNGGAGDDSLDGGSGIDTAVVGSGATYTPTGIGWTVTSSDGTDSLVNVEIVDSGPGSDVLLVGSGGFATIQAAVDAASDGDTILVAAGTYVEQVIVEGLDNLTIRAADGAQVTIKAPADLVETARSSSDREVHAVLTAKDSLNLTLQNIDIDGDGRGNTVDEGAGAGQANFYGIFYRNSSGSLLGVDITGVRDPYPGGTAAGGQPLVSGVQRGVGLVVDNDSLLAFSMIGGSISDFQKNATSFNRADLNISGVTITGGGAQTGNAQNGIQVGNSTGSIAANTITGIGYAGASNVYSGAILAFSNTNLDIAGNVITGANIESTAAKVVGIYVLQSGGPSSGGSIVGNSVSHIDEGIVVVGEVTPDGIVIESNSISNIDGTNNDPVGIYFEPDPSFATVHDVDGSAGDDLLSGGAGNDSLSGLDGNDILTGEGGDDTLDGAGDEDTAVYHGPRSGYTVTAVTDSGGRVIGFSSVDDVDAGNGDEGTDNLIDIEKLQFGNLLLDLADPVQLFDGSNQLVGTFDTIQAAVNAAASGYTIRVAAGTYAETVTVDEDVTILGPNAGVAGSGSRAAEAIIDGGVHMNAAGATLDGLTILGGGTLAGNPAGIYVDVDNVTLTNLIVQGDGTAGTGIVTPYNGGVSGLVLSNSRIDDWTNGTYFNPTTQFTASGNSFDGNGVALTGDDWDDGTVISGNSFTDSSFGHVGYGVLDTAEDVGAFFGTGNSFDASGGRIGIFAYGTDQEITGTGFGDYIADTVAGSDGIFHGEGGNDYLDAGSGDDTLEGGAGDDILIGGSGTDTAVFADDVTLADIVAVADADPETPGDQPGWTVTTSEGTDYLTGIEIIDGASADILFVGAGGFSTIQAAVDAANDGDTILVAAGTYVEQVVVDNLDNLTIRALDGAQVTIQAPADVVETARSSSDREIHAVFTVKNSANVLLENIDVDGRGAGNTVDEGGGAGIANYYGVYYRNSSGGLENVDITGVRDPYPGGNTPGGQPNVDGVQRGVAVVVDNDTLMAFAMHGGTISDFQKQAGTFVRADLDISGVTVIGGGAQPVIAQNGFSINQSTGTVTGNTLTGIGYAGPAAAYSGVILASSNTNLVITDNVIGGSNGDNAAAKVVGIWIYQNGPVNSGGEISGNAISHTDVGIAVDNSITPNPLLIEDNTVTNPDLTDPFSAGVRFEPMPIATTTAFDIDGTAMHDVLSGNAGNDVMTALGGNDSLRGNGGDDTLDGGTGTDTATYAGAATIVQNGGGWTVTDSGGTDSLTNIEIVDDSASGVTRLVGNNGYATIQAAIDASSDGDIIILASGTYVEDLDVNKDVTILGPNQGVDGTATRGSEAIIDGQVVINAAGVTIDGVKIVGSAEGPHVGQNYGVVLWANNFTLTNSVLSGTALNGYGVYVSQVFGFDISDNLISGYGGGVAIFSGNATGSIHDNLFQGDGGPATGLNVGIYSQTTQVTIADNAFDGIRSNSLVLVPSVGPDPADLEDYVTGNMITDSGVATPVLIFPTIHIHNFLGTDHAETFEGALHAEIGAAYSFDGRGGDDVANGGEEGDSFAGGSGSDQLNGNGGDDTLTGGGDDDVLNGGDGFDTATYAGSVADYTITVTTDADGRVTGYSAVVDNVPAGGDEGSDTLTSIEKLSFGNAAINLTDPVQLFDANGNIVGTFETIQAAIDAASDDYTIRVAAGTYDEDLTIDVGVTILGAEAGEAVAGRDAAGGTGETNIVGHAHVTATDNVTLDGLRFLNDGTTTGGGSANPTLMFQTGGGAAGHIVTNSIFWSTVAGGANGVDDRAISTQVLADGLIRITDNLISGTSQGQFTTASWGRGIWFDGGGVDLVVTGNTIEWSRTGLNLDMSGDSTANVSDNSFRGLGTGIAVGIDADGLTVGSNDLERVGTDFSFRNLTTGVTFNAGAAIGVLTTVGDPNDLVVVLGGSGNDDLTGTGGADVLDGNNGPNPGAADTDVLTGLGGNDTLLGRGGNDTLDGGTGDDAMTGGTGDDIYVVDTTGDAVNEASGEGIDEVRTSLATYTLAAALENLTGLGNVNQTLTGNSSDNVIDGGLGADAMTGGAGNDTYVVDNAGDTVTELAGEGTDEIRTSLATYTLAALANIENLTGTNSAGQTLTGNGSANVITGAAGNDVIDGGAGADTMAGGAGNDLYFVDNAGDVVIELPGPAEGVDEVRTALAVYSIVNTAVENLTATSNVNHDFRGNSGANVITGGSGNDIIRVYDGGDDTVIAGDGIDNIFFGATLTAADVVTGGGGVDTLIIQGNYAGGLTLSANVTQIENISILGGNNTNFGESGLNRYDYILTTNDANFAAGVQARINGAALLADEDFTFNGSAETNASFVVYGGKGVDTLTGGFGNDIFIYAEERFAAGDTVNGGPGGYDGIFFRGNYTIDFNAPGYFGLMTSIENMTLTSITDERYARGGDPAGFDYNITLADNQLLAGVELTVSGALLQSYETMIVDGSLETDGTFRFFAGKANDTLKGGANNDLLLGNLGADTLSGGGGADTFRYDSTADSNSASRDQILDFTPGTDKIDLSRVDAKTNVAGDQAFTWIGSNAFTGSGAASAGQLRAFQQGGSWFVEGDTNGDGVADLSIQLTLQGPTPLSQADFFL